MARKIRFPLQMKNGAQVRTLEELRENFDLESVLGYFENGKLATWLKDRYYDELAESICQLNSADENLNKKLCDLLGVAFSKRMSAIKLDTVIQRNEKLNQVRQITDNEEIIASFSTVAFNQAELEKLLKQSDVKTIYVHGDHFHLPLVKRAVRIVGIANPQIDFGSRKFSEYKKYGITIENAQYKKSELAEKEVGDIIVFGEFEGEPIEWFVIQKKEDSILVISKRIIDVRFFGHPMDLLHRGCSWRESAIRSWLNEDFYTEAFSKKEHDKILLTSLCDVQTKDQVFLLSSDEINTLITDEMLKIDYTKFALLRKQKDDYPSSFESQSLWRISSRTVADEKLWLVCTVNHHREQVCRSAEKASCIRPAMYLNID